MFPTLSFGDTEIAPAELATRAAKAAGFLATIGLADGDTFAVMLRNQPALIEIMLAARQLGAYFVPLNWHFTATETSFILRDSGAKVLIIGGDLLPGVADGIPVDMPVYRVEPLAPPPSQGAGNVARDWNAAVEDSAAAPHQLGQVPRHGSLHVGHDGPTQGRSSYSSGQSSAGR